jgi:hypothetical protein
VLLGAVGAVITTGAARALRERLPMQRVSVSQAVICDNVE